MVSKHCMESDTNIRKPRGLTRRRRRRPLLFSRLARVIFLANLFGLAILIVGSMALNQYTKELVSARIENLNSQAGLITSFMGETATGYGATAQLDLEKARDVLTRVDLPEGWRARLHDQFGQVLADTNRLDSTISMTPLESPAASGRGSLIDPDWLDEFSLKVHNLFGRLPWQVERRMNLRRDFYGDIRTALSGSPSGGERYDEDDNLIVTVSLPVKRVQKVLGVVTLESSEVGDIIAGERRALTPFIGLAIIAAFLSSIALTLSIAQPLRHLARAAEIVARSNQKRGDIPDFSKRRDEIGDLSIVLREMTSGLYSRIDDIANFAADVAHEIKNPLTSLRSASDTLRVAKTKDQRDKLIDIIQDDVSRMDRLITDISKASKVDANLARETAESVDIHMILDNLAGFYQQTMSDDGPSVEHLRSSNIKSMTHIYIRAFETPFAQVLRNLIDNALTFSPPDGEVRLRAGISPHKSGDRVIITVDDDGPGIPPDNLETVFERFYTQRPEGAQFGSHSGLGLAICRQIISAHNGKIHAENRTEAGEISGARFVIDLPQDRLTG